jgi:hypothetical protein
MTTDTQTNAPDVVPSPPDRANTPANRVKAASSASFEPRRFITLPAQFGKSSMPLAAAADIQPEDPRLLAAQLQHLVCNALRESLLAIGQTPETFARNLSATIPGMGYDRLSRLMRGKTVIQLADLLAWSQRHEQVRHVLTRTETWETTTTG